MTFTANSYKDFQKKVQMLYLVFGYDVNIKVSGIIKKPYSMPDFKICDELYTYNDRVCGLNTQKKFFTIEKTNFLTKFYAVKDNSFPLTFSVSQ